MSDTTKRTDKDTALPLVNLTTRSTSHDGLPEPALASSTRKDDSRRRLLHFQVQERSQLRELWDAFHKRISTSTQHGCTADLERNILPPTLRESIDVGRQRRGSVVTGLPPDFENERLAALPDDTPVDIVVVDRDWQQAWRSSSDPLYPSPEKAHNGSESGHAGSLKAGTASEIDQARDVGRDGSGLWYRVWSSFWYTFISFDDFDNELERLYQQEDWNANKLVAFISSLFLIVNWVIGCAMLSQPFQNIEILFYFVLGPIFSLSVPVMIAYDWPFTQPIIYQLWIAVSVWSWPIYQVLFMDLCGYYGNQGTYPPLDCTDSNKDFFGILYYATALPTIAVMALQHHRVYCAPIAVLCLLAIISGLIAPHRPLWIRYILNLLFYWAFLLYMMYTRERNARRLFLLREQLRAQAIATQQAEQSERFANDAKRRLTSYIFHEVRVPLNSALLAVQNMEASGNVDKEQELEFVALQGSLTMMSKVLNDVLDFNRMDAGRLEFIAAPFAFHSALRSLFVPLRLAAVARGLDLIIDFDKNIDIIVRKALYQARGETPDAVAARLAVDNDEDVLVVGDETRLRQITTNLASNATKFTPEGGQITIRTRLILPTSPDSDFLTPGVRPLTEDELVMHEQRSEPNHQIIVRLEIEDTGFGIRPRDLRDNKLFSPYVQTDIGKQQGGKGSGLGLALVRNIISLSGGRLGLRSLSGNGSCFWIEIPLGVGSRVLNLGAGAEVPPLPTAPSSPRPSASHALHHARASSFDAGKNGRSSLDGLARPRLQGFRMNESEGTTPSSARTIGDVSMLTASSSPAGSGEGSPFYAQSASGQANSALRGIMEMGGKVELVAHTLYGGDDPQQHSSGAAEEALVQNASIASRTTLPHPHTHHKNDSVIHHVKRPSSPSSLERSLRPTFIPLPSRGSYTSLAGLTQNSTQPSPASLHPSGPTANSTSPSPVKDVSGLQVLVVDDDFMTRMLMSRMLTRLGCAVHTAENGQVAVDLLLATTPSIHSEHDRSPSRTGFQFGGTEADDDETTRTAHHFDAIFLDNQMPMMSGLDVVRRLRADGRQDLCVGCTGNALLTDQQEFLTAGVNKVLTKPILEKSIKEVLAMAMERRHQAEPTSISSS
ncbi:hypothetical protein BKA62DRAFT_344375 [Auriculariales sp. MPI-PUGE-AT-0066]|nr:hypothetical protein BKA62DRAFT_344375 [Auriculariales sp. MPI-PUGE-AT-0066]